VPNLHHACWISFCHEIYWSSFAAGDFDSSFLAICFVCFGIYDVNDFSDDFDCGFWKQHASMPLHRALGFCQSWSACFSLEICFHFFCAFAHHQPLKLSFPHRRCLAWAEPAQLPLLAATF